MKRRSKYKLKLYDEAHLVERGGIRVSWWGASICALLFMALFIGIGMGIVWYTPIKKRLPGYMVPEQRGKTEVAYIELDSLQKLFQLNQAYLENLQMVLATEPISTSTDTVNKSFPFRPDSLWDPSPEELKFLKKMEAAGYKVELPAQEADLSQNQPNDE